MRFSNLSVPILSQQEDGVMAKPSELLLLTGLRCHDDINITRWDNGNARKTFASSSLFAVANERL